MLLIPEFAITLAIGVLLLLYIISRIVNSRPGYLARKNNILEDFQQMRTKSLKIQETLSNYILQENGGHLPIEGEITHKDFLRQLQKNHILNLADKNYARLKKTHNRVTLRQARTMLSDQHKMLKDVEHKLKHIL